MLRLVGPQAECLFDVGLPVEVRELPADLAALDVLLDDATLFRAARRGAVRRDAAPGDRPCRWTATCG